MNTPPQHIIHLDMDAFYAAVEVLDNPSLKGCPVIVGGGKERGVVSSASYEARKCGVHSAQPTAAAMRLCPGGVFLPVRMSRYRAVSRKIFDIFRRFTPLVEPLSIDEAFLDVSGCTRLFGPPENIARRIKQIVLQEIGLTVSAGVAPSKFVAKIASDLRKPDGLVVVEPDQVADFLEPLPVRLMWGVGGKTHEHLQQMGVRSMGDLRRVPPDRLKRAFGVHGGRMAALAWGDDPRHVEPERETKSIGSEETYLLNITDRETARRELLDLALRVGRRLRRYGLRGRTIALKVKYSDFRQVTRSETFSRGTDDGRDIFRVAADLIGRTAVEKRPVRLLGITVSNLEFAGGEEQISLFRNEVMRQRQRDLTRALDALADRFGEDVIRPAALIPDGFDREK